VWKSASVSVPTDATCVVFVPDKRPKLVGAPLPGSSVEDTKTALARGILPATIPRSDAVFNLSRVALLVNAFSTGNLSLLRVACQDALHQVGDAACHARPSLVVPNPLTTPCCNHKAGCLDLFKLPDLFCAARSRQGDAPVVPSD
jgi:hypothetical protein